MHFLLALTAMMGHAQEPPIPAIVEAFRTHDIVALGNVEFRGNEQSHAFQVSLIRDPRFQAVVNDVVVEFGNARYQDVMDRFISGGDVPVETLRRVWQDTTQVEFEWDCPIYEDLFRVVRQVNASLPESRRLRVLLGDPPVDWTTIHTLAELQHVVRERDAHAADVVRREVLEKGRRALVIYGGQHLARRSADNITGRLAKDVFIVLPDRRRDLAVSWPVPSLVVPGKDGADALLYLGPLSSLTRSKLSAELCEDPDYMKMRLGRLNLIPPPPAAGASWASLLNVACGKQP